MKVIEFTIYGIPAGSKNNMGITRTGHHYPKKRFATWRDNVVRDLKLTMQESVDACVYFDVPCLIRVFYWAGDKRRRDVPAMLDGIFHCFERAGLVSDDSLIREVQWYHYGYDKKNPRMEIKLVEVLDFK
jgi:Holliday junction resolvase RusA-like endonuclease